MKRLFQAFFSLLLLSTSGLLLYLNASLYDQPSTQTVGTTALNRDVLTQLHFLQNALRQGAAHDMQQIFPEGYVFMHALYGLTWAEVADKLEDTTALRKKAVQEVDWAYQQIASEEGKGMFDPELPLEYGAFYSGWSNYLLGKKLALMPAEQRDSLDITRFQRKCDKIANLIQLSTPYPESYSNAAWPADGIICVASLALHDQFYPIRYKTAIRTWLATIKVRLDPATGLIPHAVDARTGKSEEGARGSSQSLILCFLKDIDQPFAFQQFKIYQKLFFESHLGLPGIREYPLGKTGKGDVDSGPIIWHMGGAATIVGIKTMNQYGAVKRSQATRISLESVSFPFQRGQTKCYLWGQLPIVDAFIAWASPKYFPQPPVEIDTTDFPSHWRLPFHSLSALFSTLVIWWLVKQWGKRKSLSVRARSTPT